MTLIEKEIIEHIEKAVKQLHAYNTQTPDEYDIQEAEIDLKIILRNLKEYWK